MPSTFEMTFRLATFCWNFAFDATVGTPILANSAVNASIETYAYLTGSPAFCSSRK